MSIIEDIKLEQPIFFQTLYNELKNKKQNHAYLIEGHDANHYAKFLIKCLLCQEEILCCDNCRICHQIDEDNYIDLMHYNGKNETIKKNTIEKIQEQLLKTSVEGNGKVYYLENIENSTPEAINSLLKILEEPVDGIYAIFTCENTNRVLPTIVSRCQIFRMKPLNMNLVKKKLLEENVSEENANILINIESSYDKMLQLANSEAFQELIIEAMNFIEDYYFKKQNLAINTQTNLLKKYKDRENIILFLDLIILGFKDILNKNNNIPLIFTNHEFLLKCEDTNKNLIKKIEEILKIKNDITYNANIPLIIDRLVYNL